MLSNKLDFNSALNACNALLISTYEDVNMLALFHEMGSSASLLYDFIDSFRCVGNHVYDQSSL